MMEFRGGTAFYGIALFLPPIVTQLGFSPNKIQLPSAGPSLAGFIGEFFKTR